VISWREDIFVEKSLLQAYKVSRNFKPNRFNQVARWMVFLTATVIAGVWSLKAAWQDSHAALTKVCELGFDLSVQILGFLIGGFAIFATVTDHRLMVPLASAPMDGENVSVFKYVFFNFISVFFVFLLVLVLTLSISIISSIAYMTTIKNSSIAASINSLLFILCVSLIFSAVLRLKSFIWNIYQAFLIFISVSDSIDKNNNHKGNSGD
jgi:hypothetical protein